MARVGRDVIAAIVYIALGTYLFEPYFANFRTVDYLIVFNCSAGAFGCYILSKRWVAGLAGRFFAGAIYGFGPFMFFLAEYHPTAGSIAAFVPWLFLPAAFGPKGGLQWTRILLSLMPFVVIAGIFRLAGMFGRFPLPTQIRVEAADLISILAPAALINQVNVPIGFYHVAVGGLVIGIAMLLASRRYSVMVIFAIGIALLLFDSFSGAPPVIWLTVPLLCCAVLIGEGIEGIIHSGYSDRKWILASAAVLLACAIVSLIFGTKATHVFAGLGAGYTRRFIEAAVMYVAGTIAIGVVFFLAKGKSRLAWVRTAIMCAAVAVDIFISASKIADSIM